MAPFSRNRNHSAHAKNSTPHWTVIHVRLQYSPVMVEHYNVLLYKIGRVPRHISRSWLLSVPIFTSSSLSESLQSTKGEFTTFGKITAPHDAVIYINTSVDIRISTLHWSPDFSAAVVDHSTLLYDSLVILQTWTFRESFAHFKSNTWQTTSNRSVTFSFNANVSWSG